MTPFETACGLLATALESDARQQMTSDAAQARNFGQALARLRDRLLANVFGDAHLADVVRDYDARTREDGFHALHDWDGKADRVNANPIAIDVLNYLIDRRGGDPVDRRSLAIVLDYYLFYVIALLSLRVWDEGDPNTNFDRLTALVQALQGPNGSGQMFAANAETLMLVATSHYEPKEHGYRDALERCRGLDRSHRATVGLLHAASMGGHLRFGFEATYGRDTVYMRDDNVADYPWLCFALSIVVAEYARLRDEGIEGDARDRVVEALLNGLSPDARAFVGQPPKSLSPYEADRRAFYDLFHEHRDELLGEFERHRPSARSFSPLSLFFNFSQNVLKGTVVDALLRGKAWALTFNDLLTAIPRDEARSAEKVELSTTLMAYARKNPDTIRGKLMPVIVYDPQTGREAFSIMMRKLAADS